MFYISSAKQHKDCTMVIMSRLNELLFTVSAEERGPNISFPLLLFFPFILIGKKYFVPWT